MIRGEELKNYIEEYLQYDVRDVEQFYAKTKTSRLSLTLDLEHNLNIAYSPSDLVSGILVSWLSLSETQALLKTYLSENLSDNVLDALPEGYFVEKKTKHFEVPLHPGSYKRRELREYVAKSWQYLTGMSRPNFANPKKRPKNLPKQIPWKDPLSMSIPQLRLASQWLSYTIDGIAAKRISPDQFRDKGVEDSLKADIIKGFEIVKKLDNFKLTSNKNSTSKFVDTIAPLVREMPRATDYVRVSNEGPRRVSCDVIRWDGSYPAFDLPANNQDAERGDKNIRDFRPRSMSNIETRKLERADSKEDIPSNEPYQPFRTLSFSSKNPKSITQTSPLANQTGLQFVMKPINHPTMQSLPFKVKPNVDASGGPPSNDTLNHTDPNQSSQYQFVQHRMVGTDVQRPPSIASHHPIPGALPPTQTTSTNPQPAYSSRFLPTTVASQPLPPNIIIPSNSPHNGEDIKKERKNSVSKKSPKRKHKLAEDTRASNEASSPQPAPEGPTNRRLSLGAKPNDNSSSTQFVFVSYPDRRGSVSSVSSLNNASNTALAPSTASNTSVSSFNSGSGADTKETPTGTPEPLQQRSSPTSKDSPKSQLTFHSYVPPSDGIVTQTKTKRKSISNGRKKQFAFSDYMKSSPPS
ncbi:hypothetical protein K7432_002400 [Basidiobolus ranarum]|uniref:Uncharacterized protein n=1 Tax=Basidiobolus ranarum TaxID=34480 RepID=A0ABR2W834_9FUNG